MMHTTDSTATMPRGANADCARFDVVVAGAGLIGAAGACLFARQGLKVALVEAQAIDARLEADRRVSAINHAAAHLLAALGAWPDDAGQRSPYRAMEVWDARSAARISFRADDLALPCLGHIVENRVLLAAMIARLRQNDHASIIDNAEIVAVDSDLGADAARAGMRLGVALANQRIETRLLVGADGARSRVRELCGIQTRFLDFEQDAITAIVSTADAHFETAWQCFVDTGPAAMLPLADGRCALVWSCDRARADALMRLDAAQFAAQLQPLFAARLGDITACGARRRFALGQHHANAYIADSMALVGDAAHLIHPLAGLGANLGFIDAAALAEVVERAAARGVDIGQRSVLRRYERWRRGDNAVALAMMRGFKEIFGSRNDAVRAVRGASLNLADSIPPLKAALARLATGVDGDLPALCRGGADDAGQSAAT